MDYHSVVRSAAASIPPLAGGLLSFAQVFLRLDEVCLKIHSGFVVPLLGPPGSAVFLELSHFFNGAIHDSGELFFGGGIARCCTRSNFQEY